LSKVNHPRVNEVIKELQAVCASHSASPI
jgi:hypothetical protein